LAVESILACKRPCSNCWCGVETTVGGATGTAGEGCMMCTVDAVIAAEGTVVAEAAAAGAVS